MIYRGHVKNGIVVLDEDVRLPDGTQVKVEAVQPANDAPRTTLGERFRNIIGVASDLPADMAENHDHYIHGTPKQP